MKSLNVFERLGIMAILPKEGSFLTLKILRGLKDKIGITGDEINDYELRENDGKLMFNVEKMTDNNGSFVEKEFDLDHKEEELIADALKEKEKQKKLTESEFTLYEKFIGD